MNYSDVTSDYIDIKLYAFKLTTQTLLLFWDTHICFRHKSAQWQTSMHAFITAMKDFLPYRSVISFQMSPTNFKVLIIFVPTVAFKEVKAFPFNLVLNAKSLLTVKCGAKRHSTAEEITSSAGTELAVIVSQDKLLYEKDKGMLHAAKILFSLNLWNIPLTLFKIAHQWQQLKLVFAHISHFHIFL